MYSDSVMIGYADVGIYRIIFQFTTLAAFTTVALRSTLWPRVSRWDKIGETGLIEESLSRAFTYSLILALPLFVGGALLGDKLLYFFYGADFVSYTTLMILLTLVTMSLNAVLARHVLARMITLRVERSSLLNICKASIAMGAVVGVYRLVVPLSNVWLALVPVLIGGVVYGVLILKLDRKIYEELKGIMIQMTTRTKSSGP